MPIGSAVASFLKLHVAPGETLRNGAPRRHASRYLLLATWQLHRPRFSPLFPHDGSRNACSVFSPPVLVHTTSRTASGDASRGDHRRPAVRLRESSRAFEIAWLRASKVSPRVDTLAQATTIEVGAMSFPPRR
jgi:hypothetical protein